MCMFEQHVPGVFCGAHKRKSDFVELELDMVVSFLSHTWN